MGDHARTETEEIARECGLSLLEQSAVYERGIVSYDAGHETLAIAGLVARQRRLLRAAYLLADEGHRLEAQVLIRAMFEFVVRQKWLQLDPHLHYVLWVLDDLKARLRIDQEVREQAGPDLEEEALEIMRPEVRELYEGERERMRGELARLQAQNEDAPGYPNLREQAEAVGLGFSYSLAYRFDSQSAAHPSAFAIEQLMEEMPDLGGVRILPEPPPERAYADPYSVGAFVLYDALNSAAAHIPELAIEGMNQVAQRLERLSPAGEITYPIPDDEA